MSRDNGLCSSRDEKVKRGLSDHERVAFWKWFIDSNLYVTRAQDVCDEYERLTGVEVSCSAVCDINRKLRFVEWYLREYQQ